MENRPIKKNNTSNKITIIILLTIVAFSVFTRLSGLVRVSGSSMSPTYSNKELLFSNIYIDKTTLKQNDVIVFRKKASMFSTKFIKRIVAVPGDTVEINNGYLYVNNELQETVLPAIQDGGNIDNQSYTLNADEYYVLGDNRNESNDSRFIGPIKASQIVSKINDQRDPQ